MEGILGLVLNQLGGGGLDQIGATLGLGSKKETENAVGTAVGVLTAAMEKNSSTKKGKKELTRAIEKDHDGSIFDNLTGFLGDAMSGPGSGILGHVLGGQQPQVETAIAEKSGLSLEKVTPLLIIVAPLVMGALGKMRKGSDAEDITTTLTKERKKIEEEDNGIDLGSILGTLGGLGGLVGGGSSGGGGGGGLLGMLGGLFGGSKKNG